MRLITTMDQYLEQGIVPFHMPGHKRRPLPVWPQEVLQRDVTEVDELDDLHHPTGAIAQLQDYISDRYSSRRSFCLVNGSSSGILAAMAAAAKSGDTVLVARNCHKSVYHGLQLLGVQVRYLYPRLTQEGLALGLQASQVEAALQQLQDGGEAQPKTVILTSPTYEGATSEVAAIVRLLHQRGISLIVDEAHGAHFRYHRDFPQSAVEAGADLVIQSLHKTLPALTQTAVLHWQGDLIEEERLAYYLQVFQTSSPSYVFLQNIESCMAYVDDSRLWEAYMQRLRQLRSRLSELGTPGLYLCQIEGGVTRPTDPGKLVLAAPGRGALLYSQLRERFGIQAEMQLPDYCLLMTAVADSNEMYGRLVGAIRTLTSEPMWQTAQTQQQINEWPQTEAVLCPAEAMRQKRSWLTVDDCVGRIAAGTVYPYPPGIPLIVPGERIDAAVVAMIETYIKNGSKLVGFGIREEEGQWQLSVIKEEDGWERSYV